MALPEPGCPFSLVPEHWHLSLWSVIYIYKNIYLFIILCIVWACVYVTVCVWSQRTAGRSWFSPSIMWTPGIELGASDLATSISSIFPSKPLNSPCLLAASGRIRLFSSSRISEREDCTPMWICEKLSQDLCFLPVKSCWLRSLCHVKNMRFYFKIRS